MVIEIQGNLLGAGKRFGIVLTRWNSFVGEHLLRGALDMLERHGVATEDIEVVRVPGSFEVPLAVQRLARASRFDGLVCLGVLIRGGTPHFEYLAAEVTKGIAQVALESETPITFGILTCDTLEQAIERSGAKAGNKGAEAASAALEMVNLLEQIPDGRK